MLKIKEHFLESKIELEFLTFFMSFKKGNSVESQNTPRTSLGYDQRFRQSDLSFTSLSSPRPFRISSSSFNLHRDQFLWLDPFM